MIVICWSPGPKPRTYNPHAGIGSVPEPPRAFVPKSPGDCHWSDPSAWARFATWTMPFEGATGPWQDDALTAAASSTTSRTVTRACGTAAAWMPNIGVASAKAGASAICMGSVVQVEYEAELRIDTSGNRVGST